MDRSNNLASPAARALGMLLLTIRVSCSKASAEATSSATPAPQVVASAAIATATVSASAPSPSSAPPSHMKEYASPAADRLGVLAAGTGIPVGQVVPPVSALDLDGKPVNLADL